MARDVVERLRELADSAWPPYLTADEGKALLAVVEAAKEVSRIEATGVLPEFQPLADALARLYAGSSGESD